ncbi:MAG: hypothetical protein EOM23_00345 [Candidatus Moranbacteria bacterium]|nr:hypothetical protein [Candidatus Moranbacteria bacterium]
MKELFINGSFEEMSKKITDVWYVQGKPTPQEILGVLILIFMTVLVSSLCYSFINRIQNNPKGDQ